ILLGERAALSQDTKGLFVNTGTIHILAISGLHIGLIALILVALFRFLRLPRKAVFILTIFLLICYAFLSGARPSVVRATVMAVIVLFGFLINRETKIYNSLGLAALLILIVRPHYLFDAGFQLSFLSVISIIYLTPKIEKLFPARNRCFLYLIRAFSVSLAAWIGIAPLVAFHFNIVTPVAVLANLVVIPCLFLIVSVGISFLIFAYLWVPLGVIFAQTSWLSLLGLTKLTALISKIPLGFFHLPRPGIFFFCGYYALIFLLFNYERLKISAGKAAIILALAASVLAWTPLFKTPSDKLTVTFLDVGLGDAIFVEFPYSAGAMLIDGGPAGENDAGRWAILPFLWNKGINEIDAVLLTHPDNDHIGGLAGVLKNVKVNYVFDNGMPKESTSYNNYKTAVTEKVPHYRAVKRGEEISGFPQVKLFVLHPPGPHLAGSAADTNNNSLVLKLVYKDVSFLFCADIQRQAIEQILPYGPMLKSTVIKVPHHGSDEGEEEDYLFQAASAQLAVISVDRDNRLGLPAPKVVKRLEHLGAKVYKTGDSGAVIISTDGRDVRVETSDIFRLWN
ncbi:MAG: DNA internalization-related competence protein ComEC/Rec2, partial [Candidatus Omnitrophica bacterium]|nr:DNA internalization-related competence protein ComEC/Rec2 [Candidatus Omnitrophota bacterium]